MDPLRDLLRNGHAHGRVSAHVALEPDEGIRFSGADLLAAFTVLEGEVFFERGGMDPVALGAGELMLVPRGLPYRVLPFPGAPASEHEPDDDGVLSIEHDPAAAAHLLCGAYVMQAPFSHLLFSQLSPLVAIRPVAADNRLTLSLRLIADELADQSAGWEDLVDHALVVALALSLRAFFAQPSRAVPGWYQALADPILAPAIYAIGADLTRDWSVDELAGHAAVSRARFARRFREVIGKPPVAALTEWRMNTAAQMLLDDPEVAISAISSRVGYRSEYAFATAFRRHYGEPPGRWRRGQRQLGFAAHE